MEAEYEAEQRRAREAQAQMRKIERQYKEMLALTEDDKRRIAELSSLNDSMSLKIKTYKRQIDEAVRICQPLKRSWIMTMLTLPVNAQNLKSPSLMTIPAFGFFFKKILAVVCRSV